MVDRAKKGWFSDEDARDAPKAELAKGFTESDGGWQTKPEIQRLVRFEISDLLRAPVRTGAYDLVMCRNVVIYFNEEVRDELHGRLAASLRPGGYLMVGNTERVNSPAGHGLQVAYSFLYRRI
jgi:chemotaxis protein methyltransferase CheR